MQDRIGRLASLMIMKVTLPSEAGHAYTWLETEYKNSLNEALSFAQQQVLTSSQLSEIIFSYQQTIGDIEQHMSGEDHMLDPYLQQQPEKHLNPAIQNIAVGSAISTKPMVKEIANADALAIQSWIQQWVEKRTALPVNEIAPEQSFVSFGLDSVDAVELTHDLNMAFSRQLKPDLAWNYPTIIEAANFIAQQAVHHAPSTPEDDQQWQEGVL